MCCTPDWFVEASWPEDISFLSFFFGSYERPKGSGSYQSKGPREDILVNSYYLGIRLCYTQIADPSSPSPSPFCLAISQKFTNKYATLM